MILSKSSLISVQPGDLQLPAPRLFELPEKILQFGTGVLLRGLPDYFVDKANRSGVFNGRVVVVKSTDGGDSAAFGQQDNLYTICVRGIDNGNKVEENIVSSAISRVISARDEWHKVLECAANPQLNIIVSNTTEVGISLVNESIHGNPPTSFPGKLLAFLYERYNKLGNASENGTIIIPTELIVDNGKKLQAILNELALFNKLAQAFIEWLNTANIFCSSLVDRIVPGKPSAEMRAAIQNEFKYDDELMIMAEVYRLWAIQGNERVRAALSFAKVDDGVVIEEDIDIYRELKLRMLNGTHTLSCGLAVLAGFETVKEAMTDSEMVDFIASLMLNEIAAGIPYTIDPAVKSAFGKQVLDRFRNPYLDHKWLSITMQFTSKMKMRNVPVLLKLYDDQQTVPRCMALGFAAYIFFMRSAKKENGKFYGEVNGISYHIQDDHAATLDELWKQHGPAFIVNAVLSSTDLWGTDLSVHKGFTVAVNDYLEALSGSGAVSTLKSFREQKTLVI
jgi:tagaturonate reductase